MATTRQRRAGANPPAPIDDSSDRVYTEDDYAAQPDASLPDEWESPQSAYCGPAWTDEAYLPDEAFTVQEALDSFTHGSAYASFEEHRKGKIQPGQLADFVVLEENPFTVSSSQLSGISLLQTFLGGRNVYKKS